jgi:hypothetical protein
MSRNTIIKCNSGSNYTDITSTLHDVETKIHIYFKTCQHSENHFTQIIGLIKVYRLMNILKCGLTLLYKGIVVLHNIGYKS